MCVFVCFVRLWISPPRIKLAASYFAGRFIGVQGRERHIFVNFAPPEAPNLTNRSARPCCNVMLLGLCDLHAYHVRAAYGRRIGMCGYTSVPADERICFLCICTVTDISADDKDSGVIICTAVHRRPRQEISHF